MHRMINSMKRVLHCKFADAITANRIEFSDQLLKDVLRVEGGETSMVPMIDYAQVHHILIPRLYDAKDEETTARYRRMGLSQGFIEQIQKSTPGQRQLQEEQFEQYVSSPGFSLDEGETMESFRAQHLPPFFPLTYIPLTAVPKRREVVLNESTQSVLYSLAAQMPYPKDVSYEPLFGSYIESCMNILSDNIFVNTSCSIFYNYRIVPTQLKIIFYLTVVHPRKKELARVVDISCLGEFSQQQQQQPAVINTNEACSTGEKSITDVQHVSSDEDDEDKDDSKYVDH